MNTFSSPVYCLLFLCSILCLACANPEIEFPEELEEQTIVADGQLNGAAYAGWTYGIRKMNDHFDFGLTQNTTDCERVTLSFKEVPLQEGNHLLKDFHEEDKAGIALYITTGCGDILFGCYNLDDEDYFLTISHIDDDWIEGSFSLRCTLKEDFSEDFIPSFDFETIQFQLENID